MDVRVRDDPTLTKVGVGYALTAHVHRLAAAIIGLVRDGEVLEAVPLVRAGYESALTAVWCIQIEGGPIALANKHVRQRKAFIKTLNASKSLKQFAVAVVEDQPLETDSTVSAENFEAMCNDLEPAGPDAYAHFRLMSSMTHPSAFLCDFYLADDSKNPENLAGFALRDSPDQPVAGPYLALTLASLIWSGRAVEYLDKHHPRRSQLRTAAKLLGMTSELHPSATALGYAMTKKGK